MRFADRTQAGQRLAGALEQWRGSDVVVLGLPRGGVPVAYEVALALGAPLDVIVVRKVGVPGQRELAMGAIGEGGVRVVNYEVIRRSRITEQEFVEVEQRERADLDQLARQFRPARHRIDLASRTAIIVDDGIATGSTAAAACQVARALGAARVILAAPVGAPQSVTALGAVCDEVICLHAPEMFMAVGSFYDDFRPVPDAAVTSLLARAAAAVRVSAGPDAAAPASTSTMPAAVPAAAPSPENPANIYITKAPDRTPGTPQADAPGSEGPATPSSSAAPPAPTAQNGSAGPADPGPSPPSPAAAGGPLTAGQETTQSQPVTIPASGALLPGELTLPENAASIIVFVPGTGSGRASPRGRYIAAQLNDAGLGTLLLDLQTPAETDDPAGPPGIETQARRLADVTAWLRDLPGGMTAAIGYFGASAGAGVALWAAAEPDAHIDAVVCRGGRVDLAAPRLAALTSPTLLIVGEQDEAVLDVTMQALPQMSCAGKLVIVPGATHLFPEPGTLGTVARLARDWFCDHFGPPG